MPIPVPNAPPARPLTLRLALFAVLALLEPAIAGPGPATITNQPASQIILEGQPATFTVGVDGTPPFAYQWQRDGTPVGGATNPAFTLTSVSQADHQVLFAVAVSNSLGGTLSASALLRVDPGILTTQLVHWLSLTNTWRYNQSNANLGSGWRTNGYPDAGWPVGQGTFDGKKPLRTALPNGTPVNTQLSLTNGSTSDTPTYYFRTLFTNALATTFSNLVSTNLQLTLLVDDGAAVYLNGAELYRTGVISGASFSTYANRTIGDASFEGPPPLPGTILQPGENLLAAELHQVNATSTDITFSAILDAEVVTRMADTNPPVVTAEIPGAGAHLASLTAVEVMFSEDVEGVDAADLLINGSPAATLVALTPSQYRFEFPSAATGTVQIAWSPTHGIHDLSARANSLVTNAWSYTVDPNAAAPNVFISEFMAGNHQTLRDEDGDASDWIELHNGEATSVDLTGWALSDTTNNLAKWRFPSVYLPANGYLLVWASGKNRTNPIAPVHANFTLDKSGEYLGLSTPSGLIVSEFRPAFPSQSDDVSYGRDLLDPNLFGYYTNPTPAAANATLGAGFGPAVRFSSRGTTFTTPFSLVLDTPTATNAVIHYLIVTNAFTTAATNVPTSGSPVYTTPLTINRTMMVRARAFLPNGSFFPGPPHSESYLQLDAMAAAYDSDLPVVVLHTLSSATIPGGYPSPDQIAAFAVFEPRFGVTRLTDAPTLLTRAAFNIHGSSSASLPKPPYAVELQDEFGGGEDHALLGMPAESDWSLYGPDCYDLSLMNNLLLSAISDATGEYASRMRFVELFINNTGGALSLPSGYASTQYRGIYILQEKIKRGKDRLDIDPLQPEQTNAPAITGGYLFKIDRADANEVAFKASGFGSPIYQTFVYVDPKGPDLLTAQRAPQTFYLTNYLNSFYTALTNADWTNRVTGWAPYVDWPSAIDHHLINLLTFNTDAIRLSAYLSKPRGAPLHFGPVWDADRGLGSSRNETRPFNPRCWIDLGSRTGAPLNGSTDYFNGDVKFTNAWYRLLFKDADFFQAWIDRYQQLRQSAITTNSLFPVINSYANEARRAQPREVARWGGNGNSDTRPRSGTVTVDGYSWTFDGTYQGEINFLQQWLSDRLRFMDTNFLAPPTLSSPGGPLTNGFSLTLTDQSGEAGTQLYYTLDGTDPRAPFGAIAANAALYSGPFTPATNARVVVRARNPAHANLTGQPGSPPLVSLWSGPAAATFVASTPPLRITEIMYHPAPPPPGNTNDNDNFEYLELRNIGAAPLSLAGFNLTGGIGFTGTNLVLAAGQSCVVVADLAAFQARYGTGPLVAGQYTNRLANGGDHLVLQGSLQEPILDFNYSDAWYPATDGLGFSLVLVDPTAATGTWGLKSSWRPSGALGGTPGANEPTPAQFPAVVINEALTHTDLPAVDAIELFNSAATSVDLGGWFLTDDFNTPQKYRIPAGTLIGPGGYRVFYADTSFGADTNAFLLSSMGEEVWLFSGDASSNVTGFAHGFSFGPQANGVTFGRYVNSVGTEDFVTQKTLTLGQANSGPLIGPVLINEFCSHPPDLAFGYQLFDNLRDEFIQLVNLSDQPAPLFDPLTPSNTWQLDGAVSFVFPTNRTLAPGGVVVVVGFDPIADPATLAAFRAVYPTAAGATVLGPWTGKLGNNSETIKLLRPDRPNLDNAVPYILVEKIAYQNTPPWTTNADGSSLSLHRAPANAYANDPASWTATMASPGVSPDTDGDGLPDWWEVAHGLDPAVNDAALDPDGDGLSNLQEYLARTDPHNATSTLKLVVASPATGQCALSFPAMADLGYTIQVNDGLTAGGWTNWQQIDPASTNRWLTLPDPAPAPAARFFRLVTPQVP